MARVSWGSVLAVLTLFFAYSEGYSYGDKAKGWNKIPKNVHPYAAQKSVKGWVELDPRMKEFGYVKAGFAFTNADALYVIAYAGGEGAPPVAVARITDLVGKAFPIPFSLGPENRMTEESRFVGPFTLKVKLSRHGDASTRPGDLIGFSAKAGVKPGDEKVRILLSRIASGSPGAGTAGPKSAGPKSAGPKSAGPKSAGPKSAGPKSAQAPAPTPAHPTSVQQHGTAALQGVVKPSPAIAAEMKKSGFLFRGTDTLFVIATAKGANSGPPAAVVKIGDLVGRKFPVSFSIGPEHLMMGGALSGEYMLKAKLSRAGGVATQRGDYYSDYDPGKATKPGGQGIDVVLDKKKN